MLVPTLVLIFCLRASFASFAPVGSFSFGARVERVKRAISYESETPIPCVTGCNIALDLINACVDSGLPDSAECLATCTQTSYNRTVQCLECTLVHGGSDTLSALQRVLADLDTVCQSVNPDIQAGGGLTGVATTTGPFSTSTTGNTLTLEIWTGLTAYVSPTSGSAPSGAISLSLNGSASEAETEEETRTLGNTRALPTVVSTPSGSGLPTRVSSPSSPATSPSASAAATSPAAAPNAAPAAFSLDPVHAVLGMIISLMALAIEAF